MMCVWGGGGGGDYDSKYVPVRKLKEEGVGGGCR